jgi:DNA-binding SARP family transcriptional activator/tetratricopeptide (TPR) repeat protein
VDQRERVEEASRAVLTVGVLGPLEVSLDGRPVELTSGRLRTVLAVLSISAGRAVPVERLVTALWNDDPPDQARRGVQTHLTRLRAVLGAGAIRTTPAGYLLNADPDRVDALRFARLLGAAAETTDPAAERARLADALALWRGTPFDGVRSDWLAQTEAPRLTERYLTAVERRVDLDLAGGWHADLVGQLRELTARHPLRESLWVRLLLVLDRSGRQAEALERYETIRVRLADELGTIPGPALRRVHANLLAGTSPPPTVPATAVRVSVPRQLPTDVDGFTGRDAALKALNDLVRGGDDQPGAVAISAIAGTAGVGKTALAIHWAHQVADRFPDGQLYVNLRGFGRSGKAMEPAEAIRGFLDALGVPAQRVPSDLEVQAGLYRSLLAGRRMLILLDNARDAEQVRPLLPGSPTCLVVVTSRNQLTSLIATASAHPLVLDLLPPDEARALLARRLGPDRVAAEPAATGEIITSCARLPLALAIVAARAATHAGFPLRALAAELRDARSGLDAFTAGDTATDARAVFSWSYQALSAGAARLFRLLALPPGPDLAAPAAASLAGLRVPEVRPLLTELTDAHLLTEHLPGRYTFHDLLRAYATELTHSHDHDAARDLARQRVLDHYLHTAYAATMLLHPYRSPITVAPARSGAVPQDLTDPEQAQAWFTAEHAVLVTGIAYAADAGCDTHAWQLAWTLEEFLFRSGQWREWADTQQLALAAARRLDEPAAQARTHRGIASACTWLGRYEDAATHFRGALDLYERLGDLAGQAGTEYNLALLFGRQDRHPEALHHARRALELSRAGGESSRETLAAALNYVGWEHAKLGNYQAALDHCQQALVVSQQIGQRLGEASTWDSLGYIHHRRGDHRQAASCYQHALERFRELGNRYLEAETLTNLGDSYLAAGEPDAARTAWRRAAAILDQLDHPDAAQVRGKLDSLPAPASPDSGTAAHQ